MVATIVSSASLLIANFSIRTKLPWYFKILIVLSLCFYIMQMANFSIDLSAYAYSNYLWPLYFLVINHLVVNIFSSGKISFVLLAGLPLMLFSTELYHGAALVLTIGLLVYPKNILRNLVGTFVMLFSLLINFGLLVSPMMFVMIGLLLIYLLYDAVMTLHKEIPDFNKLIYLTLVLILTKKIFVLTGLLEFDSLAIVSLCFFMLAICKYSFQSQRLVPFSFMFLAHIVIIFEIFSFEKIIFLYLLFMIEFYKINNNAHVFNFEFNKINNMKLLFFLLSAIYLLNDVLKGNLLYFSTLALLVYSALYALMTKNKLFLERKDMIFLGLVVANAVVVKWLI